MFFSTRNNSYVFSRIGKWNDILEEVSSWLSEFLRSDSNALKIKVYNTSWGIQM